jgi:hypothetical protein
VDGDPKPCRPNDREIRRQNRLASERPIKYMERIAGHVNQSRYRLVFAGPLALPPHGLDEGASPIEDLQLCGFEARGSNEVC